MVTSHDLKIDNYDEGREFSFWEGLRETCLLPESQVFGGVAELKEKLAGECFITRLHTYLQCFRVVYRELKVRVYAKKIQLTIGIFHDIPQKALHII